MYFNEANNQCAKFEVNPINRSSDKNSFVNNIQTDSWINKQDRTMCCIIVLLVNTNPVVSWSLIWSFPNTHYILFLPQGAHSCCELECVKCKLSVRVISFMTILILLYIRFELLLSYWFGTEADISLCNAYTGCSKSTGTPLYTRAIQ